VPASREGQMMEFEHLERRGGAPSMMSGGAQ